MKQSFTAAASPAPTVESSPSTNVGSADSSSSLATRSGESSLGLLSRGPQILGEIDISDIKLPRINCVQKSGQLSDAFPFGTVVLAREAVLGNAETPFNFVVITIKKQYQEKLPFDPNGPTPKLFNTAAEVRANGGSLQYGDANYYQEIATALVLVEAPEDASEDQLDQYFFNEHDGKNYALALWTFTGSAYNNSAKHLITAGTVGHLKGSYVSGRWQATTEKRTYNGNTFCIPKLKPDGKTTPEFQEFALSLLGNN